MIHEEIWREVVDPTVNFSDYKVSNLGRVLHIDRPETVRKSAVNHRGFPTLTLFTKNHPGSRYVRQVNKLVAYAFLGPPPPRMDAVWHLDGNLLNCQVDNLKWDMRARVLEWNEMHREGTPKYKTPRVIVNKTGDVYENAYECALAVGDIETAIVTHIEKYPAHYADHARYRFVYPPS